MHRLPAREAHPAVDDAPGCDIADDLREIVLNVPPEVLENETEALGQLRRAADMNGASERSRVEDQPGRRARTSSIPAIRISTRVPKTKDS